MGGQMAFNSQPTSFVSMMQDGFQSMQCGNSNAASRPHL
jgi:hypothetical protein